MFCDKRFKINIACNMFYDILEMKIKCYKKCKEQKLKVVLGSYVDGIG